jgi:hypothetical protein
MYNNSKTNVGRHISSGTMRVLQLFQEPVIVWQDLWYISTCLLSAAKIIPLHPHPIKLSQNYWDERY